MLKHELPPAAFPRRETLNSLKPPRKLGQWVGLKLFHKFGPFFGLNGLDIETVMFNY